ncbi:MAG: carboxypeptidase regulatory-like domain-containing protein [Candidatus Kapaibacterium sp.]
MKRLYYLLVILAIGLVSVIGSYANNAPENLKVSYEFDSMGDPAFTFDWKYDINNNADWFEIYYREQGGSFTLFGTADSSRNGTNNNQWQAQIKKDISYMPSGTYEFMVKAVHNKVSSPESNIFTLNYQIQEKVFFTQMPAQDAYINEEYKSKIKAVSSLGNAVKYQLVSFPNGMNIDEDSGDISWQPSSIGNQKVRIRAYLASGPSINVDKEFYIKVHKCKDNGKIKGTVSDKHGNEIPAGYVMISEKSQFNAGDSISYMTYLNNGEFIVDLPAGEYYLEFGGKMIEQEWYKDAYNKDDATPITIDCGETVTISAEVGFKQFTRSVTFISNPPLGRIQVGEEFIYDADAIGMNDMEVNYSIVQGPDGITIDKETGLINWTADKTGKFYVIIEGYIKDNPQIYTHHKFFINVTKCEVLASVIMTVKSEEGHEIVQGDAIFYKKDPAANENEVYAKAQIYSGFVSAMLDEGEYYVHFNGQKFHSEWYQDAETMDKATAITVSCGYDTLYIDDVVVEKLPEPEYYTIEGTVYDDDNNQPLSNAMITVYGMQNSHSGKFWQYAYSDAQGNYSVKMIEGYDYILRAEVLDSLNTLYLPQYYNRKTDASSADRIFLDGNKTGIDFYLTPRQVYDNEISGIVLGHDGLPLENVFVTAYSVNSNQANFIFKGFGEHTNQNGEFKITNLIPGEYVLHAYPADRLHLPGYYMQGADMTTSWKDATIIDINENTKALGKIIKLDKILDSKGKAGIKGVISSSGGTTKIKDDPVLDGSAISGASVYLMNSGGKTFDVDESAADGSFEITGLKPGTYKLMADRIGFDKGLATITIESDEEIVTEDMALIPVEATSVRSGQLQGIKVYPVPADDKITVSSTGHQLNRVELIDMNGRVLQAVELPGAARVEIMTQESAAGIYFLRVYSGTKTANIPVIIK